MNLISKGQLREVGLPAHATEGGAELPFIACDLAGHDKPSEFDIRIRVL
ncbi:msr9763 (plasmid) [Mesorhizobium japonicum MAFF 303099]|uniref:Msr9763 protein n=1 Tax=Mesorhizobium japonicum (strain LMG 29417 / CECT 9101 / MAFF 303099) TaxID=266835 RepID=Q98P05_RHILO|nr:msr9763 [Mesorhizobium japonicum MAFF 303099]